MRPYQYLFFDLDHTLWDFETNSVNTLRDLYKVSLLSQKGIHDFDDFNIVYHEINDKLWASFRQGTLSRQDLRWKRMWQTLLHYKINDEPLAKFMSEKYLEILPTKNELFPFAIDVLKYCKAKGYEMHLITNGFELTQQQKLKNSKIDSYFDKMITSEMAMSMKPHKEIFHFAFSETGAQPHNSIMIGDALDIDVLGARNAGMHQVYFNPNELSHEDEPTFEITCLSELKNIF
jgi:putative hydrolase of the HAD superfamily